MKSAIDSYEGTIEEKKNYHTVSWRGLGTTWPFWLNDGGISCLVLGALLQLLLISKHSLGEAHRAIRPIHPLNLALREVHGNPSPAIPPIHHLFGRAFASLKGFFGPVYLSGSARGLRRPCVMTTCARTRDDNGCVHDSNFDSCYIKF